MTRTTRKYIDARFERAMEMLGVPYGATWIDGVGQVGVHFIDYSPYGGYIIQCIRTTSGGHGSPPFGTNRRKCSEFLALLDGIIGTIQHQRDTCRTNSGDYYEHG